MLGNDTSDALSPLDGAEVKSETLSPTGDWKDKTAVALDDCNDPQKPKIWSLADTAVAKCKTPPPAGGWPAAASEAATTFPLPPTIGPGGTPFGRYSHPTQSQAQAAQSQAQAVQSQSQSQSQSSSAAAAGYHHSPGYAASAGGGGGYGGMAAPPPPPPGLTSAGYSEPQTDTPPQTPPSLKLGQLAKLSQLGSGGSGGSLAYGGYSAAAAAAMSSGGRLPTGLERRADGYPAGQLSAQQQQQQQQHHTHMQQQQQQHHHQQQQQMPLDMNSYAAAYKE